MLVSTRDPKEIQIKESLAIIQGLSKDGGLFVRKNIPNIALNELQGLINKDYYELAVFILCKYLDEFTKEELEELIKHSYKGRFDVENCVKVTPTKDSFVLELFHGPTCAFKDMALLVLPNLLRESHLKNNDDAKTIILTATSGDTGSSALNGFKDLPNTKIIVFYPTNGVSAIQERQMCKLNGTNTKVIAIDGNFDDAQKLVKQLFNDEDLKNELNNTKLSSANSINIGRLLPQIVYYFYGYFDLVNNKKIKFGEEINFAVPTGNFGDILAGYMAKRMGLPIHKLICASNQNNVLTDFFNNHIYNKNRNFYQTISPSMDILVSSNLERLLYYVTLSPKKVLSLMRDLDEKGLYTLDQKYDLSLFYGEYLNEGETKEIIKKVYEENNYLIDTHTAVSYGSFLKYQKKTNDNHKTIVLSTAHPYKFPCAVLSSLGEKENDEFLAISRLEELSGIKRPQMIKELNKEFSKEVWTKEEAYKNAVALIKEFSNV